MSPLLTECIGYLLSYHWIYKELKENMTIATIMDYDGIKYYLYTGKLSHLDVLHPHLVLIVLINSI